MNKYGSHGLGLVAAIARAMQPHPQAINAVFRAVVSLEVVESLGFFLFVVTENHLYLGYQVDEYDTLIGACACHDCRRGGNHGHDCPPVLLKAEKAYLIKAVYTGLRWVWQLT